MSTDLLKYFASYIERELGIVYAEANYFQLQNRLDEIARTMGVKSIAELQQMMQRLAEPRLKQLILDTATNNETLFYRDPAVFRAVNDHVFPSWASDEPRRIWSAACSSGQEPYSLSMLVREAAARGAGPRHVEILATDISSRILERARQGRYSALEVKRGLPEGFLARHFEPDGPDHWRVSERVRAPVKFASANLLGPIESHGRFDLIFCRNVLIYQSVENKARVIAKFVRCLKPGGVLVLGAGESLLGVSDMFTSVRADEATLYRLAPVAAKESA